MLLANDVKWIEQATTMFEYMDMKDTSAAYNAQAVLTGLLAIAQQLARVADALEATNDHLANIAVNTAQINLSEIAHAIDSAASL